MRRRGKIDSNQNEIVKALRMIPGISVAITSALGDGFTDLVIGYKRVNYLIELKDGQKRPSKRRLTPEEEKFHSGWKGQIDKCDNLEQILMLIGL